MMPVVVDKGVFPNLASTIRKGSETVVGEFAVSGLKTGGLFNERGKYVDKFRERNT
jgi:hypothetical protein